METPLTTRTELRPVTFQRAVRQDGSEVGEAENIERAATRRRSAHKRVCFVDAIKRTRVDKIRMPRADASEPMAQLSGAQPAPGAVCIATALGSVVRKVHGRVNAILRLTPPRRASRSSRLTCRVTYIALMA